MTFYFSISNPFPQVLSLAGTGLNDGDIYIGVAGQDPQTHPQQVYWDSAGAVPASQPLETSGGYVIRSGTPATAYIAANYSIRVRDKNGAQVYYSANVLDPVFQIQAEIDFINGPTGSSFVGFVNTGTGAVARTVQGRLRETISVKDFGAVGDGATDDILAFEKAIASFPNNADAAPYSGGDTIFIPEGIYKLSRTLEVSRQIILTGVSGPTGNAVAGSVLLFPTGCVGIIVHDSRTSPLGTGANGTIIENLALKTTRGATAYEAGCYGIQQTCTATVRNCLIVRFGDDGLHIKASSGGVPNGNCNGWQANNVRLIGNGGNGMFVDGADANAGTAIRIDAADNLQWGIYDSSFLGNTYIGCEVAGNTVGAYKTDDTSARNMFLGCYSESGQPASSLVSPTMVVGGLHGAGFTSGTDAIIQDAVLGALRISNPVTSSMVAAGKTYSATVGGNDGTIHTWRNPDEPVGDIWRLRYRTGNYDCNNADSNNRVAYSLTTDNTTQTFGTGVKQPYTWVATYVGMGSGAEARRATYAGAAPTTGLHGRGEICFNSVAAVGDPCFWMCTVTGTPGTWVAGPLL